jgi:hypothetical protein
MKTFKEWLASEGVFDSRWSKASAGAFLGGPVGAAVGYSMGDTKQKSPQGPSRHALADQAVEDMKAAHARQQLDDQEREKRRAALRAQGKSEWEIYEIERQEMEKQRADANERLRRAQLGFFGRAREDMFGRKSAT